MKPGVGVPCVNSHDEVPVQAIETHQSPPLMQSILVTNTVYLGELTGAAL